MKNTQLRFTSLLALSAALSACGGPAVPNTPDKAQASFTLSAPQGAAPTAILSDLTDRGLNNVEGWLNNPGQNGASTGFGVLSVGSGSNPVTIRQIGVDFGKISATIKAGDVFAPMPADVFLARETGSGATVRYREGTIANPDPTKLWESMAGTGTVTVTSVSPELVTVKIEGVVLSRIPTEIGGTDYFTVNGTISYVPRKSGAIN